MNTIEKAGTRITYTLLVIQSLFSAAMIMAFTVSSIIAVSLAGGNQQWTGVPSTVVMIGAAIIAYPIGRLIDRIGYRNGLSVGYMLGLIGMVVAGMAVVMDNLWLFLLGVFGLGLARGTVSLGRYAAADAVPPQRRARAIGLVVLGGTVGSVGGPALIEISRRIALWLEMPVFSGPWLLGSFCFGAAIILAQMGLRPDPQTIAQQFDPPTTDQAQPLSRPLLHLMQTDPRARLALGALLFGQLAMVLVMTITPVHMYNHPHELSAISLVIMAHTFGMFGLSFMTGRLVDTLSAPVVIALGTLILAFACLTAPFSDEVAWLALALFLLGLGWNFCFVAGSSLLSESLLPHEKGRIQGAVDGLVSLASGAGTLGGGFIFAAVGFWSLSWLTILITLPPMLQALWLRRTEKGG